MEHILSTLEYKKNPCSLSGQAPCCSLKWNESSRQAQNEQPNLGVQTCIQVLYLLLPCDRKYGRLLTLSVPERPHLPNRDSDTSTTDVTACF